jgi:hypothetical protein
MKRKLYCVLNVQDSLDATGITDEVEQPVIGEEIVVEANVAGNRPMIYGHVPGWISVIGNCFADHIIC